MEQPSAAPTSIDISIADRLSTGRAPGRDRTTGSMSVLGSALSNSLHAGLPTRVNILVRVASSIWTSSPTISLTLVISAMLIILHRA